MNVPQHHFNDLLSGKLISFLGGHASGFKNLKEHDTYVEGETQVFRVRGTTEENVRASQQVAAASSLESDDVFLVINGDKTYLWQGKDSNELERTLASGFVEHIAPGSEITTVQEGEEPDEFWELLGGKDSYKESFENDLRAVGEAKLFHLQINSKGKIQVEEIEEYEQRDLVEDDVMVLDNGTVVYIWVGSGAEEEEKKQAIDGVQVKLLEFVEECF